MKPFYKKKQRIGYLSHSLPSFPFKNQVLFLLLDIVVRLGLQHLIHTFHGINSFVFCLDDGVFTVQLFAEPKGFESGSIRIRPPGVTKDSNLLILLICLTA